MFGGSCSLKLGRLVGKGFFCESASTKARQKAKIENLTMCDMACLLVFIRFQAKCILANDYRFRSLHV